MARDELEFAVTHGSDKVKSAIESIAVRDPTLGQSLQSLALGFAQITDALRTELVAQNKRIERMEQDAQKSNPKDRSES